MFAASTLVVESVCVLHEYLVLRETREGIRSFGIGIQTVKSHHVSAESQTQVLGKSRAFNLQRLSHPFKHLIIFFFDTESRLALAGLEFTVDQGGLRLDAILLPQLPVLRLQAVPPHLTNNFAFQGKYNGRSSAPSESSSAYLIVLRQQ